MIDSDVTVVACIEARSGQEEALTAVLEALMGPTRAESGCLDYAFFRDAERPTHFISIERWVNAGAAAAHLQTPHVQAAFAAAATLLAAPPQIRSYRRL